jgi:hypothetical protein
MSDVEQRVRAALRMSVADARCHPDEGDVARRLRARRRGRRRRRNTLAVMAAATAIVGMLVTNRTGPEERAERRTAQHDTATTTFACAFPPTLPFTPTVLPEGWGPGAFSPYSPTRGFAVWGNPGGIIEVWNGGRPEGVPKPVDRIEPITILGRVGTIGDISDGYSALVELGPSPCEHWALVAHPGTSRAQLRAVAEGLVRA